MDASNEWVIGKAKKEQKKEEVEREITRLQWPHCCPVEIIKVEAAGGIKYLGPSGESGIGGTSDGMHPSPPPSHGGFGGDGGMGGRGDGGIGGGDNGETGGGGGHCITGGGGGSSQWSHNMRGNLVFSQCWGSWEKVKNRRIVLIRDK